MMQYVPTKLQQKRSDSRFKIIDGTWHKLCTGPSHETPTHLPATEKYYYFHKSGEQAGRPVSFCRLCSNWAKIIDPHPDRLTGWVPVDSVRKFYLEATSRIGLTELSKRTGLSLSHIQKVLNDKNKKQVSKIALRKLMLELVSIQRKNEYSIKGRAKTFAQQRLMHGHDVCLGCGTPRANLTKGCKTCLEYFRHLHRIGQITYKQWMEVKDVGRLDGM